LRGRPATIREQFHLPGHRLAYGSVLIAVLAVMLWLVARYVSPAPPRMLLMSTGVADGAYHRFGLRYQEVLRPNGITLKLMPSSGGMENIQRLNDGTVSVAFVQGGTGLLSADPGALRNPPNYARWQRLRTSRSGSSRTPLTCPRASGRWRASASRSTWRTAATCMWRGNP
jgi:hypothetical protein